MKQCSFDKAFRENNVVVKINETQKNILMGSSEFKTDNNYNDIKCVVNGKEYEIKEEYKEPIIKELFNQIKSND